MINQPCELKVGVTGHRFINDVQAISEGVILGFDLIRAMQPKCALRFYSMLAQGADQLVVCLALDELKPVIDVVLPAPVPDYLSTFTTDDSRVTFYSLLQKVQNVIGCPPEESPQFDFTAANDYLVDKSDILLAIWDGNPAQGSGGTGDVVAAARRHKMPLIWVFSENCRNTVSQKPNPRSGSISVENMTHFDFSA